MNISWFVAGFLSASVLRMRWIYWCVKLPLLLVTWNNRIIRADSNRPLSFFLSFFLSFLLSWRPTVDFIGLSSWPRWPPGGADCGLPLHPRWAHGKELAGGRREVGGGRGRQRLVSTWIVDYDWMGFSPPCYTRRLPPSPHLAARRSGNLCKLVSDETGVRATWTLCKWAALFLCVGPCRAPDDNRHQIIRCQFDAN